MNKSEQVALADKILSNGDIQFTLEAPATEPEAGGDAAKSSSSEAPTTEPVTPGQDGKQDEGDGSDVSTPTQGEEIAYPAWMPEEAKGAFAQLPKAERELMAKAMDERKRSIEADATDKWMKAAEIEKDAKKWRTLVSDPVKGPKVLAALEAKTEPAVDPAFAALSETLGEDVAKAITLLVESKAAEKAKALIHDRIDAPTEMKARTNDAAMAYRQQLGNRVTDEEFVTAVKMVGTALGYTDENPDAPYRVLSPENVAHHLSVAIQAIKAQPKQPAPASPPKPPVSKPASVPSNGMATDSKAEPAWKREKRPPRPGEQAQETIRRHGMTEADIARLIQNS